MPSPIYALLIATVLFSSSLFGQEFNETALLQDHLETVNENWKHHRLPVTHVTFESDVERIQGHLTRVIALLESTEKELSQDQRQKRNDLIAALKEYAEAGLFPVNTFHNERTPYFIDVYNTPCAVANLMLHSGHDALVEELRRDYNYNYIKDMPQKPLLAWAETHGFETWELALIQPGYQSAPTTRFLPGNLYAQGPVNMVKYDSHNGRTCYSGEIDTLGIGSFGCITDNGVAIIFNGLEPSVENQGGVKDFVVMSNGSYVVAGYFENEYGVAIMDGQDVGEYLNITNGYTTHALELVGDLLYFDVADYSSVGSPTQVLTADLSTNPIQIDTVANMHGRVADLFYADGVLHIAGELTSVLLEDSSFSCHNYLAYEDGMLSTDGVIFSGYNGIRTIEGIDGFIYLGGDCAENENDTGSCFMVKYNGVWTTFKPRNSTIFSSHSNFSIIDDIMEFDNKVIVCGDLISDGGRGVFTFADGVFSASASINGTVSSMAIDHNNALVVAGDFKSYTYSNGGFWTLSTQPIKYIGVKVDTLVGIAEVEETNINVYPNPAREIVNASIDGQISDARLYYGTGAKVDVPINIDSSTLTSNVSLLPSGVYFLEITTEKGGLVRRELVVN